MTFFLNVFFLLLIPYIFSFFLGIKIGEPIKNPPGTCGYFAPELWEWALATGIQERSRLAQKNSSTKFDVFSFGIIANEIMSADGNASEAGLRHPMMQEFVDDAKNLNPENTRNLNLISLMIPGFVQQLQQTYMNYFKYDHRPTIRRNKWKLDKKQKLSMTGLIKNCWNQNKDKRPEFSDVVCALEGKCVCHLKDDGKVEHFMCFSLSCHEKIDVQPYYKERFDPDQSERRNCRKNVLESELGGFGGSLQFGGLFGGLLGGGRNRPPRSAVRPDTPHYSLFD